MSEQKDPVAEEKNAPAEPEQAEGQTADTAEKRPRADPVRRWTFIILGLSFVLLAWHLVADRVTPYSTQARVNALVVPIASEVVFGI